MDEDAADGVRYIELRHRTLPEQVEYLVMQVAICVAETNALKRDTEALVLAVKSLENRMLAVERATPLQRPKKAPPKKPWSRGV